MGHVRFGDWDGPTSVAEGGERLGRVEGVGILRCAQNDGFVVRAIRV